MAFELFLIQLGELALALLVAVLSLFLAVKVFDRLTKGIDEWAEIKKGNMAVAVVLSTIVLSIALMVTLLFSM